MAIIIAGIVGGVVAIVGASDSYSDYSRHSDYSDYYDDYAVKEAQRRAERERKERELKEKINDLESYINREIDNHIIDNNLTIDVPKWTSYNANFYDFESDFYEQKMHLENSIIDNKNALKNNIIHDDLSKIDDILSKIDNILDEDNNVENLENINYYTRCEEQLIYNEIDNIIYELEYLFEEVDISDKSNIITNSEKIINKFTEYAEKIDDLLNIERDGNLIYGLMDEEQEQIHKQKCATIENKFDEFFKKIEEINISEE